MPPRRPAPPSPWRRRIVGHDEVAPETLVPNPRNWRVHGELQRAALDGALADIGVVRSVTVNRQTGHLVDGHLRVRLAIAHGEPTIPVEYVELTEAEEREALLTLDPIAALAEADRGQLRTLLDLTAGQASGVQALLESLALEHQIMPATLHAGALDLQGFPRAGSNLDGAPAGETMSMTPVAGPGSNVRMVQLFLTEATFPAFQASVRTLATLYGLQTVTEIVMEALSRATTPVNADL